ncbi:sigma-70 family RNA polymerase sigma factor [Sphaerisporangium melleum]|nr:sigma-70 family RNA polymerase sigma factor [Sphaerisporangium melleum]
MRGTTGDAPQPPGAVDSATTAGLRAELLIAERERLHHYVAALAGYDPHHVEDVVQETLLRAWQLGDRLDWRDRPIRMWLFRVARNLLIDGLRKDRAVPVGVTATDYPDALTIADETSQVVDRCVLVDALRALAPAHREAVVHVHLLGAAGEDVARLLGVPKGTVKSRTHHGLRRLRHELAERGVAA